MNMRAKDLAIGTGNPLIALLNKIDAERSDLHFGDRVRVKKGKRETTATIDITNSLEMLLPGQIGLFEEVFKNIHAKDNDVVSLHIEDKPKSVNFIKKKLMGEELNYEEMKAIVEDIINNKLTDIEMTYFVAGTYVHEMSDDETVALIKAIINTGDRLKLKSKIVVDKHCVGGVAGNRTTMIVVPIIAAAGLIIPKTSSRAITSAAGTADTVEVLCNVTMTKDEMEDVVNKVGGCIVWGGAVNLAPADDKIIKVEHPLSLDPIGQLLASILAKKKSVSATHVLIDIPIGKGSKTGSLKKALRLKKKFIDISKRIGMKVMVLITDGSEPIGNGIGPALEARDVLWTLQNSENGCNNLKEKSIVMAGHIFDLVGKTKKGQGKKLARKILESGKAYTKFIEIIKAQGAKVISPEHIEVGRYTHIVKSKKIGTVKHIDNHAINRISRIAGAPHDKGSGLYIHAHKGHKVKKGDLLFTIYSDSRERLTYAIQELSNLNAFVIG
jgi:AMP phosphorylase